MRKLFFGINITIDGYADIQLEFVDEELHDFYTDLLNGSDTILFGRKTYELMESFWPAAHEDPNSTADMLRFADTINNLKKLFLQRH